MTHLYEGHKGAYVVLPRFSPQVAVNLFECFNLVEVLTFEGWLMKEKRCLGMQAENLFKVDATALWKFHGSLRFNIRRVYECVIIQDSK